MSVTDYILRRTPPGRMEGMETFLIHGSECLRFILGIVECKGGLLAAG